MHSVEANATRMTCGKVSRRQAEPPRKPGVVGAGIAQRVVDVAGEIEGFGIAGDDLDDGGQDLGLAFSCAAWAGGPTMRGDDDR
jgi:hypothetical protein